MQNKGFLYQNIEEVDTLTCVILPFLLRSASDISTHLKRRAYEGLFETR